MLGKRIASCVRPLVEWIASCESLAYGRIAEYVRRYVCLIPSTIETSPLRTAPPTCALDQLLSAIEAMCASVTTRHVCWVISTPRALTAFSAARSRMVTFALCHVSVRYANFGRGVVEAVVPPPNSSMARLIVSIRY